MYFEVNYPASVHFHLYARHLSCPVVVVLQPPVASPSIDSQGLLVGNLYKHYESAALDNYSLLNNVGNMDDAAGVVVVALPCDMSDNALLMFTGVGFMSVEELCKICNNCF